MRRGKAYPSVALNVKYCQSFLRRSSPTARGPGVNALAKSGIELGENGSIFPKPEGETANGEDAEKANEGGNECSALEHVHGSIVTWKRDASRKPTPLFANSEPYRRFRRSPRQGITVAIREAKTRHASVTADGVDDERDAVGDLKDGVLRAHVGPHPARSNRQQRARIVRMPG